MSRRLFEWCWAVALAVVAVLLVVPLLIFIGGARLWRSIELRTVYKGDAAAYERARWKDCL